MDSNCNMNLLSPLNFDFSRDMGYLFYFSSFSFSFLLPCFHEHAHIYIYFSFCIAQCLFLLNILGESIHAKTLELYFMDNIWNEMLTSRVEVLACVYVYVILIIRSMKRFSLRVTTI